MFLNRLATALFASWRPNDQHSKKGGILMPTLNKWSLGICLAIMIALLGVSPPASADTSTPGDGYTAPAPTKVDPSGVDQDAYCIPTTFFDHPYYGGGLYYVNGVALNEGCHATDGAASVTITTDYNSGTWTFDYPNDQPGEEAENEYSVVVGDGCKTAPSGLKYTEVTAYFTNVADATGRLVHSIYPATSKADGSFAADVDTAYDIADGQTVAMRIMLLENEAPGLTPGVWTARFHRSDTGDAGSGGYVVKTIQFTVPECGDHPGGTGQKASGALRQVGCKAVRVTANALRYDTTPTVKYQVWRHARGHRAHKRSIVVAAGHKRVVVLKKPPRRLVVFTLKVQRSNGWRWLDTQAVRRCR